MSRRYINGQMVEVTDHNTQAVLETLHPQPTDDSGLTAGEIAEGLRELEAALRGADSHQLEMIQQYGKDYAVRAAKLEIERREQIKKEQQS